MGTWGTGIYSNDTAEDVRSICNEIFPFVSAEEGNKIVFTEFNEVVNSSIDDNDTASFWYALADWQWKHGILSEDIRSKVLSLLNKHAGISDWEESGSQRDVRKRIAVLDKLRLQLESEMPAVNIPKPKLSKPKHKIGDIIIFRACSKDEDEYDALWYIKNIVPPYMFKDKIIFESPDVMDPIFDARDKYMAILCVGAEKVLHSNYLPDLYDEQSVYAYYDYVSDVKPTLDKLRACGFLPQICREWKDFNRKITDHIGWTYIFNLGAESFRDSNDSAFKEIEKLHCNSESERFNSLKAQKNYLNETNEYFTLYNAFGSCWEEKIRTERLGLEIDTLLNPDKFNPEFLTPKEIDAAHKEWFGKRQSK